MNTLPLQPPQAVRIGTSCFSMASRDGRTVYFSNLEPFDCHDEDDRPAMLLRVARFARHGIRNRDLRLAFGIGRATVQRAANRLRDHGEASFHLPRRGRGTSAIVGATAREAERLLASGMRIAAVARQLGVAPSTLYDNCAKGFIRAGRPDGSVPRRRAGADAAASQAGGGADGSREGPLDRAGDFLSLPRGYYGLTSILLLLAFLFMARVRNPEALRHQAPGEWGAVLGLDRCPEAKTLRRKVRALACDVQRVRGWQGALASAWMAEDPDACATLSVDGHVKVYSGRSGRLPKRFVSRQRLCLPASTSYWVNALGGRPLLCLHKDLDPAMTRALEQDILPALERLGLPGPDAPDLAAAPDAAPALTLAFDREGWSPALFARLARRGIAVITWHKGFRGRDWPQGEFRPVAAPVHGPGGVGGAAVRLAERRIRLGKGPEVRQIRRLLDSGRQVPLAATDFVMPTGQVAGALFSRWAQENFFKYMREEFNLDALPVHGLAGQDPDAQVVNPARRELDRRINRMRNRLGMLRNRIADLSSGSQPSDRAVAAAGRLRAEAGAIEAEREALKARRRRMPTHIRIAELGDGERLDALPAGERLLLDTIRMIAYRAETRMMAAVAGAQGAKQRPRRPLAELFRSDADIIPDPDRGVLRVRILGTASNSGDAAIAGLLEELNRTNTAFPGTNLRMVYELPEAEPKGSGKGSNKP